MDNNKRLMQTPVSTNGVANGVANGVTNSVASGVHKEDIMAPKETSKEKHESRLYELLVNNYHELSDKIGALSDTVDNQTEILERRAERQSDQIADLSSKIEGFSIVPGLMKIVVGLMVMMVLILGMSTGSKVILGWGDMSASVEEGK